MNKDIPKILLIEDSPQDTILIKRSVQNYLSNVTLEAVPTVSDAYNQLKSENYNLVLLDLNLPDSYGPSSISELRRFNKSVPIVVLTGVGNEIIVKAAKKNGADHFALKSQINSDEFRNILKQYIW